jgi:hypothetical protein
VLPEGAAAVSVEAGTARAQLLQSLQEANERCIQMLVHAARTELGDTFALVNHLRPLLRGITSDVRAQAARIALLLVDMQLSNAAWWTHLLAHPARHAPLPPARGSFPRASAVPLGRATLMLAWHAVRSDPVGSCLLGVSPDVARSARASRSPSSTGWSSAGFATCAPDGRIVLRYGAPSS